MSVLKNQYCPLFSHFFLNFFITYIQHFDVSDVFVLFCFLIIWFLDCVMFKCFHIRNTDKHNVK